MSNATNATVHLNLHTFDSTGWTVLETEFNPQRLHPQETVFTIGNGYLGTRGTFEEGYPNDNAATLIHGMFDDAAICTTELVNCPNWLPLAITIDGEQFRLDSGTILSYDRRLNLRLGLLTRSVRWQSNAGHILDLRFERFCSFADPHLLSLRCQVTSVNFTGEVKIAASFEPEPDTLGVPHWKTLEQGSINNVIWLLSETLHSNLQLGMTAKVFVVAEEGILPMQGDADQPSLTATVLVTEHQTITIEKTITLYTSRDTEFPLKAALHRLATTTRYQTTFAAHIAAWEMAWQHCDIVIEGDPMAQLSVRYNLFQLLIAASQSDDRVSIPAKTLSGYAYRGHVFWDTEVFVAPFLTLTQPHLARNVLNYRFHNLPGARRKAKAAGFEGAFFPWESAGSGDEVTPRWVPGRQGESIRIWCGDIEFHISADIAYAAWQYWKITGDEAWMRDRGAELILDTAVFWGSCATWNANKRAYEIKDVIGPDENHEHVNNNAFTNGMAQWHLRSALTLWQWLCDTYPETAARLETTLNLTPERLERWSDIARSLVIRRDEAGLIEQFDGFFELEEINFADYEPRNTSMQALLGIEPTNQRQILKQPDVLMLIYLLRHEFDQKTLQTNWDYYTSRTDLTYGSSLGPSVQAILACDLDLPEEAYRHFRRAALVDLEDVRLNAAEGIHAASAGGVWQSVIFGFGGIRLTEFGPIACPNLPSHWTRLKFRLQWRGQWHEFDLTPHHDLVNADAVGAGQSSGGALEEELAV
ncbi:glycoside hydrolase family 65 protein [Myxacorys almedinensis]|uniref:Glycoside hydrolase family 65 protein n=1 Tax=Myxacorys almedinensis A TaxID=2690445 RepID=A0A8J7Z4P9_9CYAN|nr:glycoside hydrolase family 65 protein [Myxacorys almedinensis]NDJ19942.1 glycoside hydrolase family 65 protein [Myxacorys almedinensis A]